jgi:hypothetical protein
MGVITTTLEGLIVLGVLCSIVFFPPALFSRLSRRFDDELEYRQALGAWALVLLFFLVAFAIGKIVDIL